MIAEERERQHHVIADRLAEYLVNKGNGVRGRPTMRRLGRTTSVIPSDSWRISFFQRASPKHARS